MSFTSSGEIFEPSYRYSKDFSGKVNPRASMRLLFPGGWNNKASDVFRWYDSQPHKHFRQIMYYKEPQGVGHEFVVLPLLDAGGAPTNWFCRLERMADPVKQLAAIETDGTEAFDYVQSFDSIQQSANEPTGPLRDANLVADITFPRDCDLYDVLAACSSIAEHPQAGHYTLQQYNCYFFCWAIILLLSRRSGDWENAAMQQIHNIQSSILQALKAPVSAKNVKLAHTLSAAYCSGLDPPHLLLCNALASELSSPQFSCSVHRALSAVLWTYNVHAAVRHGVEDRSQPLTELTLELLIGDLDVDPEAKMEKSLRGEMKFGPGVDMKELELAGDAIMVRAYLDILSTYIDKESQELRKKYENNRTRPESHRVAAYRNTQLAARRLLISLEAGWRVLPAGLFAAFYTAELHNRIAVHQKQNKGIRALRYVGNTLKYLPQSLISAAKHASVSAATSIMELEGGYDPLNEANAICKLRALELTIAKLHQGLPKQDGTPMRASIFQLFVLVSRSLADFDHMSPKKLWGGLLWDFLGDLIAGAVLGAVLAEQTRELKFICFQTLKSNKSPAAEPAQKLTPIVQLQQFIEERIVRLSKHDIDHAPIIKHIPLPAMAPPLKSQEQMKDALESIWRTASVGKRFRE